MRTAHQRDRDRIVHSTGFRRLEGKTQVLLAVEGEQHRTRLTHSLEVAQIARSVSRSLQLNEDLAEAVALAHDLGHPPFGHAGETALDDALAYHGGFDHNIQTFRILTKVEHRYALFDGLNLTAETLEGVIKHNGPFEKVPSWLTGHPKIDAMQLAGHAPLEAQIAAIADDIAYCNHDLDDGLRAGFFELDDLSALPLVHDIVQIARECYPEAPASRLIHEVTRRLIDHMVRDLHEQIRSGLLEFRVQCCDDVRTADRALVGFSKPVRVGIEALRAFLQERMYHHYRVNRMGLQARRVVRDLVATFLQSPECLPDGWREAAEPSTAERATAVRDYVAGMTDRYAINEHARLLMPMAAPS